MIINRSSKLYDFMEFPVELLWYRKWRRRLFSKMHGHRFLEVGVGTGKNLRYYPGGSSGVGIDLSEGMMSHARAKAEQQRVALAQADAQRLPFHNNAFDVVVATFVFCSVPDPVVGLSEIHRVLKPDGRLLLLEHVLPESPTLARLFNWLNTWTVRRVGVNINRRTAENIRRAGFEITEETNLFSTIFKVFVAKRSAIVIDRTKPN